MRSSAVLHVLCVGNLLLVPLSTVRAAAHEFMISPVRRITFAAATCSVSPFLWSTKRFCSQNSGSQLYGIATYDALFKYVLSDDRIRPSFLHAFVPGLPIVSSQRLDEHMNPLQKLQQLRNFLHDKTTQQAVKDLRRSDSQVVVLDKKQKRRLIVNKKATAFIRKLLRHYRDIQIAFPQQKYDGTMDFVCKLKQGDYAMVEMQVVPSNYWDRRALAYVAAFYGQQLHKEGDWQQIRRVIGINILGGGKDDKQHWKDSPQQYVRHYKVQEQLHQPNRFIDGIELIQYSIMNAPRTSSNQEQQDWVTFFKEGHYMTEAEVKKRIKTKAVLEAFEKARLNKLPADVRAAYEAEDKEYERYSDHTQELIQEGKKEVAKKMLADKLSIKSVRTYTGLSREILQRLLAAKTGKK